MSILKSVVGAPERGAAPDGPVLDGDEEGRRCLNILIVEDNEVTQDLLKLFLTQFGHSVSAVSDGETALQELLWGSFDVVLMDFHLPAKDGLEVVVEYKSLRPEATTPKFIGLTADVEGLLVHKANCENFDKIFCKPVNPNDLCRGIEQFWLATSKAAPPPVVRTNATVPTARRVITEQPVVASSTQPKQVAHAPSLQTVEGDEDQRSSKRTAIAHGSTMLTLADGTKHSCEITEISMGGFGITVQARPKIGEHVTIGKTPAWVVRHTPDGVALSLLSGRFSRSQTEVGGAKAVGPAPAMSESGRVSVAWLRSIGK